MHESTFSSWYVTRRLPLTIDAAATALDTLVGPRPDVPLPWDPLALGRIVIPTGSIVARRLVGNLSVSKVTRTVPVEVELSAWSADESEVGIRPRAARPPRRRADRYFTAALDALVGIEERLTFVAVTNRWEPERLLRAS